MIRAQFEEHSDKFGFIKFKDRCVLLEKDKDGNYKVQDFFHTSKVRRYDAWRKS